ncbi:hypothetical protein HR12_47985, partial [Microbacterium sp. SUBG005]
MSYVAPKDFAVRMIDAGQAKVSLSARDTLIRAYMAGAILALAAVFAVTISVQTGSPLIGALLFPSDSSCSTCRSTCDGRLHPRPPPRGS